MSGSHWTAAHYLVILNGLQRFLSAMSNSIGARRWELLNDHADHKCN